MAVTIKCYFASLKSEFPRTERECATGLSNSFITWLMCFIPAGSQVLFIYWAPGFIQLFICWGFVANILTCQRNYQESFLFNLYTILSKKEKKRFSGKMGWMIKNNQTNRTITGDALCCLSSIRKSEKKNTALHHFYEGTFVDLQII